MVLLKDLFTLLATGEFSQISLKKDNSGNLDESEYEKVIGHINLGLVELCKRFKLLEEEIVLHADPSVEVYYIRPEKIVDTDRLSTTYYLERPVGSDGNLNIIEITEVFNSDNELVKLNNRLVTPCVRQLSTDTLKITGLTAATTFSIVFQAHLSKIILDDDFDLETCALHIPTTIVEPLLYYVAYRVYKPMGQNKSTADENKSASYQQQYELSCQKIDTFGLDLEEDYYDEDKFLNDGWA